MCINAIDETFQSMEVITHELTSLETCVSLCVVRESNNPRVFFPPLNKTTDGEPSLPHSTDTQATATAHTLSLPSVGTAAKKTVYSGHSTETLTYNNYLAGLLDVLQSAVQCRVSRAPAPAAQRQTVTRHPSQVSAVVGEGKETSVCRGEGGRDAGCSSGRCDAVQQGSARVAVLYSGGVDSAVLAALVDR